MNIVYVHVPKTGGTDFVNWKLSKDIFKDGYRAYEMFDNDTHIFFAVFRNPIDRFVSGFNHLSAKYEKINQMTLEQYIDFTKLNLILNKNFAKMQNLSDEDKLFHKNAHSIQFCVSNYLLNFPYQNTYIVKYNRDNNNDIVSLLNHLEIQVLKKTPERLNVSPIKITVQDLTPFALDFINEYYKKGFEIYNKLLEINKSFITLEELNIHI